MVMIPTRRAHPADIFVLPWRDEKFGLTITCCSLKVWLYLSHVQLTANAGKQHENIDYIERHKLNCFLNVTTEKVVFT